MVDYWQTDMALNPQCSHGPTLLFSRKGSNRKFYVCSAFRDRKTCPFFLWQDEINKKKNIRDGQFYKVSSKFSSNRKQVQSLQKTDPKKYYCYTCELIISMASHSEHSKHDTTEIDDGILRYPTMVLKPKQKSKAESQFHFSKSTIDTFLNFLIQLKVSAVICIGCPSIHECILNNENVSLKSLLLDIDRRFLQFYEPNQFQLFNMYNCHMFDPDGWKFVETLANEERVAIIVDPPFGGRIEPLAYTLNRLETFLRITRNVSSDLDVTMLLILPYFMESVIKESLPSFSMLDYEVKYTNHRLFRMGRESAVRIFTNSNACSFVLPEAEGYKFCDLCKRWVCKNNKHCFKCSECTSKNGKPYRHCNICDKCVKETWKHCFECGICKLPEHTCRKELKNKLEEDEGNDLKREFCNNKSRKKKKIR